MTDFAPMVVLIADHTNLFFYLLIFGMGFQFYIGRSRIRGRDVGPISETIFPSLYLSMGLFFTFVNLAAISATMANGNTEPTVLLERLLSKFYVSIFGIFAFFFGTLYNAEVAKKLRAKAVSHSESNTGKLISLFESQCVINDKINLNLVSIDRVMSHAFAGDGQQGVPSLIQDLSEAIRQNNLNMIDNLKQVFSEVTGVKAFKEGVTETLKELKTTMSVMNKTATGLNDSMEHMQEAISTTSQRLKVASTNLHENSEQMKNSYEGAHAKLDAVFEHLTRDLSQSLGAALKSSMDEGLRTEVLPGLVALLRPALEEVATGTHHLAKTMETLPDSVETAFKISLQVGRKKFQTMTADFEAVLQAVPDSVAETLSAGLAPSIASLAEAQASLALFIGSIQEVALQNGEVLMHQSEQSAQASAVMGAALGQLPGQIQASVQNVLQAIPALLSESMRPISTEFAALGSSTEGWIRRLDTGAQTLGEAGGAIQEAVARLPEALGESLREPLAQFTLKAAEALQSQVGAHRSNMDRNLLEAASKSKQILDELPGKLRKAVESGATGVSSQLKVSLEQLSRDTGATLAAGLQPLMADHARAIQSVTSGLQEALAGLRANAASPSRPDPLVETSGHPEPIDLPLLAAD